MVGQIGFIRNRKKYIGGALFLIIIIVVILGVGFWGIIRGSVDEDSKSSVQEINLLIFNESYYEYLDKNDSQLRNRFGLKEDLSYKDLGDEIGVVEEMESSDSNRYLGCNIYEYNSVNGIQFLIVDSKSGLEYFIFCNFTSRDKDVEKLYDASNFLEIYGIDSSKDINSLSVMEWGKKYVGGYGYKVISSVNDDEVIEEFYRFFSGFEDVGNDYYQEDIFSDVTEEMWQDGYDEYLEGKFTVRMKLVDGSYLDIDYYPVGGYVYCKLAYYKLSEYEQEFLERLK